MEYRSFTGNERPVGVIGLGIEHLKKASSGEVRKVAQAGFNRGINYVDLVWSLSHIIDGVVEAVDSVNHRIYAAIHLGSGHKDGKYYRTQKPDESKKFFHEVLDKIPNNMIPIINIHYVNKMKNWNKLSTPGSLLEAACELKGEGYGKNIAVSTHSVKVVSEIATHPDVDSVMFQVNMANETLLGRNDALTLCASNGKPVIAMKPYAGGRLLAAGRKTKVAGYMRGGKSFEFKVPETLSSHKCLAYTLDQPGVTCTVTGPSNVDEINDSFDYFSENANRDYIKELEEIYE